MTKKQNRTLGAFEKTFWLLDQIDSKDFALDAAIEGKESVSIWRSAIKQVQQRHANLSVRITFDAFKRPVTENVNTLEIPLRVVDADNNFRWEQKVEKELSIRFDTLQGPLLRVLIIQKPQDTIYCYDGRYALYITY